jgi:hypothetical protein
VGQLARRDIHIRNIAREGCPDLRLLEFQARAVGLGLGQLQFGPYLFEFIDRYQVGLAQPGAAIYPRAKPLNPDLVAARSARARLWSSRTSVPRLTEDSKLLANVLLWGHET